MNNLYGALSGLLVILAAITQLAGLEDHVHVGATLLVALIAAVWELTEEVKGGRRD